MTMPQFNNEEERKAWIDGYKLKVRYPIIRLAATAHVSAQRVKATMEMSLIERSAVNLVALGFDETEAAHLTDVRPIRLSLLLQQHKDYFDQARNSAMDVRSSIVRDTLDVVILRLLFQTTKNKNDPDMIKALTGAMAQVKGILEIYKGEKPIPAFAKQYSEQTATAGKDTTDIPEIKPPSAAELAKAARTAVISQN